MYISSYLYYMHYKLNLIFTNISSVIHGYTLEISLFDGNILRIACQLENFNTTFD